MNKISLFFLLYIIPSFVFADFINLIQADKCETILEVFIEDDHVVVKLEIGEQDYPWFSGVIPQEYLADGTPRRVRKHIGINLCVRS